jgi:catechol 2,3-dioxygenase-like lactoylglutathione lyase family enzyme
MPKHLFATLALLLAPLLPAQQPAAPSPNLAGIAHVALRVHDLAASIAFYEKLGFVKAFELSRNGQVYEAFIKINDRQFIELYPTDAKNTQVGFLHLCFEGNDLNSVHDYYVAHGLTPNAVRTAGAGNLLFTMPGPATPQGPQNMEYTQYMPGSLHSKDFGQHLGPNRIADKLTRVTVATEDPTAAKAFYQDKLAFTPAAKEDSLRIPGSDQQVEFVSSEKQGMLAHITLGSPTPGQPAHAHQTLTDPDRNIIDIWGKARVVLLEKQAK